MFENEVAEINIQTDLTKFDFSKQNYCLLFFHYDKTKTQADYDFVKNFEKQFKYNLNWIDISDLFELYKVLDQKLNLSSKFQENCNPDLIILGYIKEYVFDEFVRTGKYYKI